MLQSPEHYGGDWAIGAFITEQNLSFYEGNVIKYLCRHKKKEGLKDLYKAMNYLQQVINTYTPEEPTPYQGIAYRSKDSKREF